MQGDIVMWYHIVMICERCGEGLSGKQLRWCSQRCSKLGLKALYKKRTADKQLAYAREYRRAKNGGNRSLTWPAKYRGAECLKCGTTESLQACHVKPLWAGGTHKHIITMCQKHHYRFDTLLREFWKS